MTIKVRYFASLGERIGRSEDHIETAGISTVADVWQRAAGAVPLPANTLTAVNLEYVSLQQPVRDGDEVAFFPPVTGG
jgi:molybdopterin synthase sulfur carrier subunit